MEKTITLNEQQVDFLTMFMNDVISDAKYSLTSKTIAGGIITKLNEE